MTKGFWLQIFFISLLRPYSTSFTIIMALENLVKLKKIDIFDCHYTKIEKTHFKVITRQTQKILIGNLPKYVFKLYEIILVRFQPNPRTLKFFDFRTLYSPRVGGRNRKISKFSDLIENISIRFSIAENVITRQF